VGKLVLLLADGKRMEILLDRERMTIGRRADNDVCLPYAAVSSEHAAIVNVLSDSYVEDLGSTNGTLVNREPVTTRVLLRDGDEIDVGRQRLVYLADNNAAVAAATVTPTTTPARRESDRIVSAPGRRAAESPAAEPTLAGAGADERPASFTSPPYPVTAPVPDDASLTSIRDIDRFVATEIASGSGDDRPDVDDGDTDLVPIAVVPESVEAQPTDGSPDPSPPSPASPPSVIRVRSALGEGRSVALLNEETTLGRIGVQTASIRRDGSGFQVVQLEGARAPRVNGVPIPASGVPLRSGDVIEIAGARVEFESPDPPPS